jgi:hypothetical protein
VVSDGVKLLAESGPKPKLKPGVEEGSVSGPVAALDKLVEKLQTATSKHPKGRVEITWRITP